MMCQTQVFSPGINTFWVMYPSTVGLSERKGIINLGTFFYVLYFPQRAPKDAKAKVFAKHSLIVFVLNSYYYVYILFTK